MNLIFQFCNVSVLMGDFVVYFVNFEVVVIVCDQGCENDGDDEQYLEGFVFEFGFYGLQFVFVFCGCCDFGEVDGVVEDIGVGCVVYVEKDWFVEDWDCVEVGKEV